MVVVFLPLVKSVKVAVTSISSMTVSLATAELAIASIATKEKSFMSKVSVFLNWREQVIYFE